MKTTATYTKEQLMAMPLVALRGLDIDTPEQEMMIQEVVNAKLLKLPPQRPIYRKDVPDIKDQLEEQRWQTIINDRTNKLKVGYIAQIPDSTPGVDAPVEEPMPDAIPDVVPDVTVPTTPEFTPESQPLAEPTGEGDPVSFASGVSPQLMSQSEPVQPIQKKRGRPAKIKV